MPIAILQVLPSVSVPAGMEIAAQMAGDVASNFHVECHKRFAPFGFDIVEDQRFVQTVFAVGSKPVPIRPKGAVTIEIEHPIA